MTSSPSHGPPDPSDPSDRSDPSDGPTPNHSGALPSNSTGDTEGRTEVPSGADETPANSSRPDSTHLPESPKSGEDDKGTADAFSSPPDDQQAPGAAPPDRPRKPTAHPLLRLRAFILHHLAFLCILIGFLAVVSPGLFIRVYPMYGDEIDLAHRYVPPEIEHPHSIFSVTTTHFGMHNLDFRVRAWFMELTGVTGNHRDVIMRVFNMIVAVFLLTAIYVFGTTRWEKRVALAMVFLAAFSHYNLFLTIMGYYCNETALAILASIGLLLTALRTSRRWLVPVALVLSAFFATLSFMLYFTGRILIGAIAVIWLIEFIQRGDFWRRRGWMLVLWTVVFAVLMIKPYESVVRHAAKGEARQRQTSLMYSQNVDYLMAQLGTDNVFEAFGWNLAQSILSYTPLPYRNGKRNGYHAYETQTPYVDPYSMVLLAMGLLLALWRWRDIRYGALLGVWLFYNLVPCGLTILNSPPYSPRAHVGMLFAWILAALPLGLLLVNVDKFRGEMRRILRPAAAIAVGGILTVLAILNVHLYYSFHNDFSYKTTAHWRMFDDLYRYYRRLGPTTTFVAAETPYALLSFASFRTTHYMQPPHLQNFDWYKKLGPGMAKFLRSDRMVVFLARDDRASEVRGALSAARLKYHEIRVYNASIPDGYIVFILGHVHELKHENGNRRAARMDMP